MPTIDLPAQFRDSPRLQALVAILRAQVDVLRADIAALATQERLAEAEGEHLDRWGALVGVRRETLGDEDFRRVIGAALRLYRSEGVGARILAAAEILGGVPVSLIRRGGAAYRLIFDTSAGDAYTEAFAAVAARLLGTAAPAGVSATVVESRGFTLDTDGALDGALLGRRL